MLFRSAHIPVRPGTDVVLALAIARQLEANDALAGDFLAAHAEGVDEFLDAALPWTIDKAARECGIEPAGRRTLDAVSQSGVHAGISDSQDQPAQDHHQSQSTQQPFLALVAGPPGSQQTDHQCEPGCQSYMESHTTGGI